MKKIDPAALTVPVALLAIFAACALAYVPLVQAGAASEPAAVATPVAAVEANAGTITDAFFTSATTPAAAAR